MKVIQDETVWNGIRNTREGLYDEIAGHPRGTTISLTPGEDFPADGDPGVYRQRIISAMRHRGLRIESRVKDGSIYVRVTGDYPAGSHA